MKLPADLALATRRRRDVANALATQLEVLADTLPHDLPAEQHALFLEAARAGCRAVDCLTHLLDPSAPAPEPASKAPVLTTVAWGYHPRTAQIEPIASLDDIAGGAWPLYAQFCNLDGVLYTEAHLHEPLGGDRVVITSVTLRWTLSEANAMARSQAVPPLLRTALLSLIRRALEADPAIPPFQATHPQRLAEA